MQTQSGISEQVVIDAWLLQWWYEEEIKVVDVNTRDLSDTC